MIMNPAIKQLSILCSENVNNTESIIARITTIVIIELYYDDKLILIYFVIL